MSRSYRKPAYYHTGAIHPKAGKRLTSKTIRHAVRQLLHTNPNEFDYVHPQDKLRGSAGSRAPDWGCSFFGDGRRLVNTGKFWKYHGSNVENKEWMEKLKRK